MENKTYINDEVNINGLKDENDEIIMERWHSEEIRILYAYRALSWILTSVVYLAYGPRFVLPYKLIVVISLLISSIFITKIYLKFQENKIMLMGIVLIEIIGIALIIFTTGGLKSPFMWYALNPILIAASYLPLYFCWLSLIFYLSLGLVISVNFFNPENHIIGDILKNNIHLPLIFVLITSAVQVLSSIVKKSKRKSVLLINQKKELKQVNKKLSNLVQERDNSLNQIMSIYGIMEAFNNEKQKEKFFAVLAHYASDLTQSDIGFFYILESDYTPCALYTNHEMSEQEKQIIIDLVKNTKDIKNLFSIKAEDGLILVSKIISQSSEYGFLGIKLNKSIIHLDIRNTKNILRFLSGVCEARLERFHVEKMEENLLIMEEQNRIANEIHDTVSQRLFSIHYSTHALIKKWEELSKVELWGYLLEFKETSYLAMNELRKSIYRLSSEKKGISVLKTNLEVFLKSISKMHNVNIKFDLEVDENTLSVAIKQAVLRIIREASINAIKHGKAKNIFINLTLKNYNLYISIKDDGKGFNINKVLPKSNGLGLLNMKNLSNTFSGSFDIESEEGKGCEIKVMMDIH